MPSVVKYALYAARFDMWQGQAVIDIKVEVGVTEIAHKLQAVLDAEIGKGNINNIVAAVQLHG